MTTATKRVRGHRIDIGDIWDPLDAVAEVNDLDTAVLIKAVLAGALRLGQIDRLAEAGLRGQNPRRRARERLPWVQSNPNAGSGVTNEAGVWRYGDFSLTLITSGAVQRSNLHREDGEGWYLEGPIGEPVLCGISRDAALDVAEEHVRQWERRQVQMKAAS